MSRSRWVAALALLGASVAQADPVTLKLASAVPEGTAWAREGMAFARDVEAATAGRVHVKWYLGGMAGDELEVAARIKRGQLDGVGSGGALCPRLAASLGVMRLPGLFQSRDEVRYVLGKLRPVIDEEYRRAGFTSLWNADLGPEVLFTRQPLRSMDDLKRARLWIWDLDTIFGMGLAALQQPTLPLPLEQAGAAYDQKRIDGFLTMPMAALAFQWSTQAAYLTDLPMGYLCGCLVLANRSFDALSIEEQTAVRAAASKLSERMERVGALQDAQLLGGLFEKQGLHRSPASPELRAQFLKAAAAAWSRREVESAVPSALRSQVVDWLTEFRTRH